MMLQEKVLVYHRSDFKDSPLKATVRTHLHYSENGSSYRLNMNHCEGEIR